MVVYFIVCDLLNSARGSGAEPGPDLGGAGEPRAPGFTGGLPPNPSIFKTP